MLDLKIISGYNEPAASGITRQTSKFRDATFLSPCPVAVECSATKRFLNLFKHKIHIDLAETFYVDLAAVLTFKMIFAKCVSSARDIDLVDQA